ncbi:MAG: class I SAM-dependent methyltransferase [Halioglobus sp.]
MSEQWGKGDEDFNPLWSGLLDARKSGWYNADTGELVSGFPVTAGDRVLDVGCGDGTEALFCARQGAHVTFTDIDESKIEHVSGRFEELDAPGGFRSVVCDSNPLLVDSEDATRIICREVLEHVDDPVQVMSEMARVGTPGALYILSVPGETGELVQKAFAPPEYFQHPNHIRIFSEDDFTSLVTNAGLEVLECNRNGFFWVMWMSMVWIIQQEMEEKGELDHNSLVGSFQPPFHQHLHDWGKLWRYVLSSPRGLAFKEQMDQVLPKNLVILARKPA